MLACLPQGVWNIQNLNSLLDEHRSSPVIAAITRPYLYFGMWKTSFAWQTEHMDLYSINYMHYGAPKTWYCIPPDQAHRMERFAPGN